MALRGVAMLSLLFSPAVRVRRRGRGKEHALVTGATVETCANHVTQGFTKRRRRKGRSLATRVQRKAMV